jgi:hypothetical protein
MTKYIQINFSNGETYWIPVSYYAGERAKYLAESDTDTTSGVEFDRVYKEEYELGMTKDFEPEIFDYMSGNTDWKEVQPIAIKRPSRDISIDYQEEYMNGQDQFVVETEDDKTS